MSTSTVVRRTTAAALFASALAPLLSLALPQEAFGQTTGPSAPGPTAVATCAYDDPATGDCWVTGDFTVSVVPASGGTGGIAGYQICRSVDSPGGFAGCDVNFTLNGGTSIVVSGGDLPSDGYRRAYYFRAQDGAGNWGTWNMPRFARVDRHAPDVSASNASDAWFTSRTATVSANDAMNGASSNSGLVDVRYRWNLGLDAGCNTGTATANAATVTVPEGDNMLYLCARDNTGRVAFWNGRYRVAAPPPLTVWGTVSPARSSYVNTFVSTASASGGDEATRQFSFFRRRPGGTWFPDIWAPNWQSSNVFNWTPTLADVGVWDTYIWVKDANTPAGANTYGYAYGYATGQVEVVGPPTAPGPTTVGCTFDDAPAGDCWVTGDFTASATAATGGFGSLVYQICRSYDSAGGFAGCDMNLTLTGGTSIAVTGADLPVDGLRRAYYFRARDAAGVWGQWNMPRFVRVDRYPPAVSASHASDEWFSIRTATVSASDVAGGAASNSGMLEMFYRWNAPIDAACTTGATIPFGTTLTAPAGDNVLYLCGRDKSGRVGHWNGRYRVAPLSLAGTVTPARSSYVSAITSTATAGGGNAATTQFAFFRRRPGSPWIPDVNNPAWQSSNVFTWNPTLADAGGWDTYIWVRDMDTPASANGYGYAVGLATGPVEIVGPPTAPGPTTVGCAYNVPSTGDCWVTGDFTASVAAATGGMGNISYQICRSNDSAGGFAGCEVNLTLNGGTSIAIAGVDLPADGSRRAYYFRARDAAGQWGEWNMPRFVRVDRHAPAVEATNASDQWFASRTATVSASDALGGVGSNSGLLDVRYRWNAALDAGCTTGTATSPGGALTAPVGDNVLYLCARDNTGRISAWSGRYRVSAPLALTATVNPARAGYGTPITWTATATGGTPATTQFAFFRRHPGGSWIPDMLATAWQTSNVFTWTPTSAEVGIWESFVLAKDGNTPPDANTYGYAVGYNPGPVEVVGPPTAAGPTTVSCAYAVAATGDCWVTGDFTASVTAATGGMGGLTYQICRSNDSAGGFAGCEVNLTLAGGTAIAVAGAHLPADGFRRAYYFRAQDAAGNWGAWNLPRFVRVDRAAPEVSASNASDEWFTSRSATVSASDAGNGAGSNSGLLEVRYAWNTALGAGCTAGAVTSSGAVLPVAQGDNVLYLCARDNTGRIASWNGRYRVAVPPPLTLTGTVAPTRSSYVGAITSTASASGGDAATRQFAFFRRRPGNAWFPDVNAPVWQSSTVFTWTPALEDVGVWDTYIWVRDANTPANANGYGYAVGYPTGQVEVVGPPSAPGPTTIGCTYSVPSTGDCWVTGGFTASVTAATGGLGNIAYQICRSNDSPGGFAGCEVNLTLSGGTSIAVTGADLPADGLRRAYYFRGQDGAGVWGPWNMPRFVRIDRYAPVVSASNASDEWFPSRTATVSANDAAGGAGSNSGLLELHYRWNTALDSGCTTGTVTSTGTTLTAPAGDNVLYVCARDNSGRVGQWNGRYRVTGVSAPRPEVLSTSPTTIPQGSETVLTIQGANLQGATVYIGTENPNGPTTIGGGDADTIGLVPTRAFPSVELLGGNAEGTTLTVRVDAREAEIDGFYNLAVQTPGGSTAAQFRVVGTAPVVDVFTPSQPVQGSVHLFLLAGANLQGAVVVPLDPAIKVLDFDNSNDGALTGLLYVGSGATLGHTEIRVERPDGAFLILPIEIAESVLTATVPTRRLDIPGRSPRPDVPDVLLQQPVIRLPPGAPADGSAASRSALRPPSSICFWVSQRQAWRYSAVFLSLTDDLGEPLTREALNRLVPGERLNFNSLTVAATATIEYEFYFRICDNWVTDVLFCVRGSVGYMVPLVGGYSLDFDYCAGTQGQKVNLRAEGRVSRHEWTTSNACMTVNDADPTSESGQRSGEIAVNCCAATDISLHTSGEAFQDTFDAQGPVLSVRHEGCVAPAPELRVFLDVGDDNLQPKADGSLDLDHEYFPVELDESSLYLPCSPLAPGGDPPGGGIPPNQLPQKVSVLAAYVVQLDSGKLRIVPPPAEVTSVEIELQQTSKLPGIATNYPPEVSGGTGSTVEDPDFWLRAPGDSPTGIGSQSVTVNLGGEGGPAVGVASLYCNDYGGSTTVRARPTGGAYTPPLVLPKPQFASATHPLPQIGWSPHNSCPYPNQAVYCPVHVQTDSLKDTSDEDGSPVGSGQPGDGLTAFSEYRGMVFGGVHYRLNPLRKDFFVAAHTSFPSLLGSYQLGVEIYRPRIEDLYDRDGILWTNIHSSGLGIEGRIIHTVRLVDNLDLTIPVHEADETLGLTEGKVSQETFAPVTSTIYTRRIRRVSDHDPIRLRYKGIGGMEDWILAHELGHAVDICHREEIDANGTPKNDCDDGATIDPKAEIPFRVFYMHSGSIFWRIARSTNGHPASSYNINSLVQIKLK